MLSELSRAGGEVDRGLLQEKDSKAARGGIWLPVWKNKTETDRQTDRQT